VHASFGYRNISDLRHNGFADYQIEQSVTDVLGEFKLCIQTVGNYT